MRREFQALIVIGVSLAALFGILVASAYSGMSCTCRSPVGFPPTCLVNPCPAHEMLVMESYKVNSPTNATLVLTNNSALNLGLQSYMVNPPNGAQFTHDNQTQPVVPSLPAFQTANVAISIAGASFTFQPGSTYTITVVTMRNNPFQFTIRA